jgi:hypothetical protein
MPPRGRRSRFFFPRLPLAHGCARRCAAWRPRGRSRRFRWMPKPITSLRKDCRSSPSPQLRLPPPQSGRVRCLRLRSPGYRFPRPGLQPHRCRGPHRGATRPRGRWPRRGGKALAGRKKLGDPGLPSGQPAASRLRMSRAEGLELHARKPPPQRRRKDKARRWGRKNARSPAPETAPKINAGLRRGHEPGRDRVLGHVLRLRGVAVISLTARVWVRLVRQDLRRCLPGVNAR